MFLTAIIFEKTVFCIKQKSICLPVHLCEVIHYKLFVFIEFWYLYNSGIYIIISAKNCKYSINFVNQVSSCIVV